MGKVENALHDLIDSRTKRAVRDALVDLTAQVRTMAAELAALRATLAARSEASVAAAPETEAPTMLRFSKRMLKSVRKKLSLTQKELAQLLGVSVVTAAAWEGGKSTPRAAKLARIAQVRGFTRAEADAALGREVSPGISSVQVRTIRRQLGLSQARFAKKLGVSTGSVNAWEAGRTRPGAARREAIFALAAGASEAPVPEEGATAKKAAKKAARKKATRKTARKKPAPRRAAKKTGRKKAAVKKAAAGKTAKPRTAPKPEALNADAIRQLRSAAGLSQVRMAKKLGVSVNTISNWETGRSTPRGGSLRKLHEMK